MKILHVNSSDIDGGAARAAFRTHQCLLENGAIHDLTSQFRVVRKLSDEPSIIGGVPSRQGSAFSLLTRSLARYRRRRFYSGNSILHSTAHIKTGLGDELNYRNHHGETDIVHLHWLGDETLSIEEIGDLDMPLVWTLHDQWAFCGAEHYTSPSIYGDSLGVDNRYSSAYSRKSRPIHESGPDLNRATWIRKQHSWTRPIHIISPSRWLADCASRSTLMSDWPITVVPNPINLQRWSPCDQDQARALLGLPAKSPLLLFGAIGGLVDERKGADLLLDALQRLRSQVTDTPLEHLELVVFGQARPPHPLNFGFPVHYLGRIDDDWTLALAYSAANLFVIPSRQDNLPNTGLEAHACGTPVVAFSIGGIEDIVDSGVTGELAHPFDTSELAFLIRSILENPFRLQQMKVSARKRALSLWSYTRVSKLLAEVYRDVLLPFAP